MTQDLIQLSALLGISTKALYFLFLIMVWEGVWKLVAMWKSARKKSVIWFILLAIINTAGILSILYIFVFSELKSKEKPVKKKTSRRAKR